MALPGQARPTIQLGEMIWGDLSNHPTAYSPGPLIRATLFKKGYPFALIRNYMDLWRVGLLLFGLTVSIIFGFLIFWIFEKKIEARF